MAQQWRFYAGLGGQNPVCLDLGEITKFLVRSDPEETGHLELTGIVADGIEYWGCDGRSFRDSNGLFVRLKPYRIATDGTYIRENGAWPSNVKNGDKIPSGIVHTYMWETKRKVMRPVCADPRLLSMIVTVHEMNKRESKIKPEELEATLSQIPTREEATSHLKNSGYSIFDPATLPTHSPQTSSFLKTRFRSFLRFLKRV